MMAFNPAAPFFFSFRTFTARAFTIKHIASGESIGIKNETKGQANYTNMKLFALLILAYIASAVKCANQRRLQMMDPQATQISVKMKGMDNPLQIEFVWHDVLIDDR